MQIKLFIIRAALCGLVLAGVLSAQKATGATFATFQQVVTAGNLDAAINFQLGPDGSFVNTAAAGNPVIIIWLGACLPIGSQTAYLNVSGQLMGGPLLGGGAGTFGTDPITQGFTLQLEFWTELNKTGTRVLDVSATGAIVSSPPYNSIGGSAGGSVIFSSGVQEIQACLTSSYFSDGSVSFALTDLLPSLALQMNGALAGFTANLSGSFSASNVPVAPALTCPTSVITNSAPGMCSQAVQFAVSATGAPTPTVTCRVGTDVITSGHIFNVGPNTVTCIAANGVGMAASCSFQVTVLNQTTIAIDTTPASPTTHGTPVTVTASVKDCANVAVTAGTVTLKEGVTILAGPVAVTPNVMLPLTTLSVGNHTLTVEYSGSGNFAPSTNSVMHEVLPMPIAVETARAPLGSLIYESELVDGIIQLVGGNQPFTLALDPGQTITVDVLPSANLRANVELRDPSNSLIGSASGAGPGQEVILQTASVPQVGTYSLTIEGASGTTGGFQVRITLNAALELEAHGGPSDDTLATAQSIQSSAVELGLAPANRMAVLGNFGGSDYSLLVNRDAAFDRENNDDFAHAQAIISVVFGAISNNLAADEDWYVVNVNAGDNLAVATTTPSDGAGYFVNNLDPHLELYGPDGNHVATGVPLGDGRNETVNFTALSSGSYRVRVRSGDSAGRADDQHGGGIRCAAERWRSAPSLLLDVQLRAGDPTRPGPLAEGRYLGRCQWFASAELGRPIREHAQRHASRACPATGAGRDRRQWPARRLFRRRHQFHGVQSAGQWAFADEPLRGRGEHPKPKRWQPAGRAGSPLLERDPVLGDGLPEPLPIDGELPLRHDAVGQSHHLSAAGVRGQQVHPEHGGEERRDRFALRQSHAGAHPERQGARDRWVPGHWPTGSRLQRQHLLRGLYRGGPGLYERAERDGTAVGGSVSGRQVQPDGTGATADHAGADGGERGTTVAGLVQCGGQRHVATLLSMADQRHADWRSQQQQLQHQPHPPGQSPWTDVRRGGDQHRRSRHQRGGQSDGDAAGQRGAGDPNPAGEPDGDRAQRGDVQRGGQWLGPVVLPVAFERGGHRRGDRIDLHAEPDVGGTRPRQAVHRGDHQPLGQRDERASDFDGVRRRAGQWTGALAEGDLTPFQNTVAMRFGTLQANNRILHNRASPVGSSFTLTTAIKNGATGTDTLYINRTLAVSQSGKQPTINGCTAVGNVGRGYNDNTHYAGDIAEVLVYTNALTDVERQAVEQYLDTKYALTTPAAPQITQQPANALVVAPQPATFTVVANGSGPLSYQWRRGGVNIAGASGSSYVLSPTTLGDDGAQFDVVASNPSLSVTSTVAQLTVLARPPETDLALWLKADEGPVLSGPAVTQWTDQSGQAHHAGQGTSARQPRLDPNALNGFPVVRFDGVDDYLTFDLPINGLPELSLFLVAANAQNQDGGGTQAERAALFWNETAYWGTVYLSPFQGSVNARFGTGQAGNRMQYNRSSSAGNAFTLSSAIKNGATDSLYVNRTLQISQGSKLNAIANCQDTGNLGRGYDDNTYFVGGIAEVLVYTRAVTEAERVAIEGYLNGKYALNLPAVGTVAAGGGGGGSVPDQTVQLQVTADGESSDVLRVLVKGQPGSTYRLEHSNNLIDWKPVKTITLPRYGPGSWTEIVPVQSPKGFFRASEE